MPKKEVKTIEIHVWFCLLEVGKQTLKSLNYKHKSFIIGQHSGSNSVKSSLHSCLQSASPSCKSNDHSNRSEAPQIGCPTVCPLGGKKDHARSTH